MEAKWWQSFIGVDPTVMQGKPHFKGTRFSVEFVVGLIENGWTEESITENYPRITPEAIQGMKAFLKENQ